MIKSMTAFASAESNADGLNVQVEIRSYNSRHLDMKMRLSAGFLPIEEKLKTLIAASVGRGRVEAKVVIRDEAETSFQYEVDAPKARAFYKAVNELKDILGVSDAFPYELLVSRGDVIRPAEMEKDIPRVWGVVKPCARETVESLNAMRLREGAYIADDFTKRLARIEGHLAAIQENSRGLLLLYQNKLKERIVLLTKDVVKIDAGRIEQEAALLADKSDISEEIVRAGSHIKQFRSIMTADKPSGHKLNFLLQEMNREFNTVGSKTGSADVSHLVVEVKSELEKLREQVQNIE